MFGIGKKKKKAKDENQKPAAETPEEPAPESAATADASVGEDDSVVETLEDRVLTGKIVRKGGRLRVTVDETEN